MFQFCNCIEYVIKVAPLINWKNLCIPIHLRSKTIVRKIQSTLCLNGMFCCIFFFERINTHIDQKYKYYKYKIAKSLRPTKSTKNPFFSLSFDFLPFRSIGSRARPWNKCINTVYCVLWLLFGFLSISFFPFFSMTNAKTTERWRRFALVILQWRTISTTYTIQTNVINAPNIDLLRVKSFLFFHFFFFFFFFFLFDRIQKRNWNKHEEIKRNSGENIQNSNRQLN